MTHASHASHAPHASHVPQITLLFPCKNEMKNDLIKYKGEDRRYKSLARKAVTAGDWYLDKSGMLCYWVRKSKDPTKPKEDDYQTSSYSHLYGGDFGLVKVHPKQYFWYHGELYIYAKRKGTEHLYACLDINGQVVYEGKYKCYYENRFTTPHWDDIMLKYKRFKCNCNTIKKTLSGYKQDSAHFESLLMKLKKIGAEEIIPK